MNRLKKYWLSVIIISLFVIAGYMIYLKLNPKQLPPNLIAGVGRIDGDLIALNTKYPARVKKIFVDEGDRLKKGQIVAQLYSREFEAQLESIKAEIKSKKQLLEGKKVELEILKQTLPEDVKKALAQLEASRSGLKELENSIKTVEEVVAQDERDYKRFKSLYEKNLIPERKFEEIQLKLKTDRNKLKALLDKKKQLLASINAAESTLSQAEAQLNKIEAVKREINALKDSISAIEGRKKQVEAMIDELTIISPVNGYVIDKIANEGEVLGAGMVVVTVIDHDELYLKIFVDTIDNGKIKIGDRGVIFLDGYPDRPIPATVVKIARKAEFTPKEVAVREDRIQRVYAVHLKPDKPDPHLKLGLPAVGVISIDSKGLPDSLNQLPPL
ncbi:HlyD family secretion protein [Persephonella sp.]